MPHAYTEDQLVEQSAIGLFAELGWTIAFGNPHPGPLPGGEGGVGLLPSTIGRGGGGEGAVPGAHLLGRETTASILPISMAMKCSKVPTLDAYTDP